jgi:hypothetical protein
MNINKMYDFEDSWTSCMGGLKLGEGAIFRSKDVFSELKNWDWITMQYYCVTGREPSENSIKFLNWLFCICFNYADPRIWNNRVAALAGTVSSTAQLAVSACSAVSEAKIYGGSAALRAVDFLFRAEKKINAGCDLEELIRDELKQNKVVFGFGRPVSNKDERVKPALITLEELNLHNRKYILFAKEINEVLVNSRYKLRFNIGGVYAAFCADEGFTPKEAYYLLVACFYIGHLACYMDSESKPEGLFFPLRCDRISYEGVKFRQW